MLSDSEANEMKQSHVIGVGDCVVTNNPEATLVTYALGSCIAVLIYDPIVKVGGLLHYMLPDSNLDKDKAQLRPFMFADTGIPLLFHQAYALGAVKVRLDVAVFGGAQVIAANETFNIGKRNHLTLRKIFWQAGILTRREDVGGVLARTVRLEMGDGQMIVRHGQKEQIYCSGGSEKREVSHAV
jgi:chemotaxis protein CheD